MSVSEVNVFEGTNDQGTPAPKNDPSAEQPSVQALVGEGKKFKDFEALAKSKLESDAYIEQLKSEAAELRNELKAKVTADEVLASINKKSGNQPAASEHSAEPVDLDAVLEEKLSEREARKAYEANIRSTHEALVAHAGSAEAAVALLKAKASELGVAVSWLKDMAGRTPKALNALLGLAEQPVKAPTSTRPTGDVNLQAKEAGIPMGTVKPDSKAYFDKIRHEDKNRYWTPEVQNAIFQAKKSGKYQ